VVLTTSGPATSVQVRPPDLATGFNGSCATQRRPPSSQSVQPIGSKISSNSGLFSTSALVVVSRRSSLTNRCWRTSGLLARSSTCHRRSLVINDHLSRTVPPVVEAIPVRQSSSLDSLKCPYRNHPSTSLSAHQSVNLHGRSRRRRQTSSDVKILVWSLTYGQLAERAPTRASGMAERATR